MAVATITVKQLNTYVKTLIEGDINLVDVCVTGEISNLKSHYQSGHLYFTLKDNDAAISCVMFKAYATRVQFRPEDGMQVVLRGKVSLYEKDGRYQFYAQEMNSVGLGDITLKYEQTKEKLASEGLFDPETKRVLPKFPNRIAVVTSSTGAAVQDIINILSRRWPLAEILMCPVSVQGELAVPEMLNTLERLYKLQGIDAAIIGRGGGSIEDLWAFNSEELARKIYEAPFPVISAVGHETDFTICDFVADLRAPTPSAAAELAVPDMGEITEALNKQAAHLKTLLNAKYKYCYWNLEKIISSYYFKNPKEAFISKNLEKLDRACDRLFAAEEKIMQNAKLTLAQNAARLDALSPLKTIARGFAAVTKDEKAVNSIEALQENDIIEVSFADGVATSKVTSLTRRKHNG